MTGSARTFSGNTNNRKPSTMANRAVVAIAAWTLFLMAPALFAQVRIPFPSPQDPGGPVYTTIERGLPLHDGPSAAVLFYREPACVPEDFNLLDGQDLVGFPDNPRAFGCPLTVDGFGVWKEAPPVDVVPQLVLTRGTGAVPVWFIAWSELEAAMADDVLTMNELRALPSGQVGYAIHFDEHRVLSEISDPSEIVATLALDGTARGASVTAQGLSTFEFSYTFERGRVRHVHIRLK
jgi:hypothetical protein